MLEKIIRIIVNNSISDNSDLFDFHINPEKELQIAYNFNKWLGPKIKQMCETRNYLQRHNPMKDYEIFIANVDNGSYNYESAVSGAIGHSYGCRVSDYDEMGNKIRYLINE